MTHHIAGSEADLWDECRRLQIPLAYLQVSYLTKRRRGLLTIILKWLGR